MNISIICPLYNGERYIESLHKWIKKQEKVDVCSIDYVLTETGDNSEEILKSLGASYIKIKPSEFSHSKTREEAVFRAKGDIAVLITQDIIINDNLWLYNLTFPIENGECEASFSRQLCDNNTIEKYIREKNYPNISRIVSKDDIDKLGLMTFFYSDAASAVRRDVFLELNGYDQKRLPTNEDMYLAHKLITSGYRIKYCADSKIVHSHKFTLKQLYSRYYDTGVFFKENSYLLDYNANQSGFALLKYVLKRSTEEGNFSVLANVIPNFAARFMGNYFGKRNGNRK